MRLEAAKTANADSAAHRRSDRHRDDLCGGGLRKTRSELVIMRGQQFCCIAWLGLRRNVHGALDRSRVACYLERVEVLLELNSPAVTDRPDVGDLCLAFLGLPVKSEVIVAESNNSLAAVALKDLVRVKHEFVETRR
jgi:hypothetical protein